MDILGIDGVIYKGRLSSQAANGNMAPGRDLPGRGAVQGHHVSSVLSQHIPTGVPQIPQIRPETVSLLLALKARSPPSPLRRKHGAPPSTAATTCPHTHVSACPGRPAHCQPHHLGSPRSLCSPGATRGCRAPCEAGCLLALQVLPCGPELSPRGAGGRLLQVAGRRVSEVPGGAVGKGQEPRGIRGVGAVLPRLLLPPTAA